MYNDYPTASYSSNVDQLLFLKIGLLILGIIAFIILLIAGMKIFKKANRNGITALIPFYNLITLIEICDLPKMYFVFLLIPIVNLYFFYRVEQVLAKQFKKDYKFGIGLFILPVVYYPILGFSKSEYVGLNIKGMDSRNQISRIEIIDENKNKEIEIEENKEEDIATRNINISLGGGKYQKDFANNLDHIEGDQVITQRNLKEQQKQAYEQKMEDLKASGVVKPIEKKEEQAVVENVNPQPVLEVFDINYIQTVGNKQTVQEEQKKVEEEKPKIETIKCPKCGTMLPKGTEFCITCGTKQ